MPWPWVSCRSTTLIRQSCSEPSVKTRAFDFTSRILCRRADKTISFASPSFPSSLRDTLRHLLSRLLDKDPHTRITIRELWDDPWTTANGTEPLVPYEENSVAFTEPTPAEVDRALNAFRASTFLAMSVVAKLKGLRRKSFSDGAGSPVLQTSSSENALVASPVSSPLIGPTLVSPSSALRGTGGPERKDTLSSISTLDSLATLSPPSSTPGSLAEPNE